MAIRKGLVVSDEQVPYQIAAVYRDGMKRSELTPLDQFIKDFQPDIFCRLGDMLDTTALQGWNNKSPKDIDWEEIKNEIRIGNEIIERQDVLLPKGCEKHFTFGNHDDRIKLFKDKFPEVAKKNLSLWPHLMRDLNLKERGYSTHGQNDLFNFGKLYMFHGNDWSTFHTRVNVQNYEVNLVYGHVHAPQRYTKVARVTHSPKSAWSLGCLCDRNPDWKQKQPNAWVNGFAVFFLHENGNFNLFPIDIVAGQFVGPNGKLYK